MFKMLSSLVIATGLALTSTTLAANTTIAADYYTTSDLEISFGLNVPNDSNDLYFSIRGVGDGSWLAIGLGSDQMAGALMLIAYPASNGQNVTISPRIGTGHTEPTYTSSVTVDVLGGSGVSLSSDGSNNTLTVNGRCRGCRSWNGGSIDVTSKAQKMVFAYGPWVSDGDSVNADLRMHVFDGVFTMDMTAATGPGGLPVITDSANHGSIETKGPTSTHDLSSPIHACVMIFTFVGLMPFGMLILRVMGWSRLHGINQTLASILGLIGAALGVYQGTLYNRSRKFTSAHQIFGILIIVAMIAQLVLGIMHHRIYKKTQQTTKMAPIHVWLGRIVIACGAANGFLGFPLALASRFNYALLALVLIVFLPTAGILYCMARRKSRKEEAERLGVARPESPKMFNSEAFGTNIRMERMGGPGEYAQPVVEPWSRV